MCFILAELTAKRIHLQMHILNMLFQSLFKPKTFVTNSTRKPPPTRVSRAKVSEMLFQVFNHLTTLGALFRLHKVSFSMNFVFIFRVSCIVTDITLVDICTVRIFLVHTKTVGVHHLSTDVARHL